LLLCQGKYVLEKEKEEKAVSKLIPTMKSRTNPRRQDRDEREYDALPGGNRWVCPESEEINPERNEDEQNSLFDQHASDYEIDPDDPPLVHRGKRHRG
jgi:hypothetical protein